MELFLKDNSILVPYKTYFIKYELGVNIEELKLIRAQIEKSSIIQDVRTVVKKLPYRTYAFGNLDSRSEVTYKPIPSQVKSLDQLIAGNEISSIPGIFEPTTDREREFGICGWYYPTVIDDYFDTIADQVAVEGGYYIHDGVIRKMLREESSTEQTGLVKKLTIVGGEISRIQQLAKRMPHNK